MKKLLWKRLLAMGVTATLLMSNPGVTALADEILPEDVSVSEEIIHDTGNLQENSKNLSGYEAVTEDISTDVTEELSISEEDIVGDDLTTVEESSVNEEESIIGSNNEILIGTEMTAVVTASDPEARFHFTAEVAGRYVFHSLNEEGDTYGTIYDSDGYEYSSDDDGGENNNFRITFSAEAGDSFILGVRYYNSGSGSIKFIVEKDPALLSISAVAQNTVLEYTHGTYEYGYDEWFMYDLNSFNPIYTVVTEAGEYTGNAYQISSQLGYSINLSSEQSDKNPWMPGKHTITATIDTISCEFEVEINRLSES